MTSTSAPERIEIPAAANFISRGKGQPVILIHGLAASLHDWDFLLPALEKAGYAGYALDLLGHGDSPKPDSRAYRLDWLMDHYMGWVDSLNLRQPAVLVGHSLGGYFALEHARRFPARTRGLVLVDPFYSLDQLPPALRLTYRHASLGGLIAGRTPEWLYRLIIDVTSLAMGHSAGASHSLPEDVRAQTALDYMRTAPGVYNLPNTGLEFTPHLSSIRLPALVAWGERDSTLRPASFAELVRRLPAATGRSVRAGHVPHQSDPGWFNGLVLEFLASLA
jgi:pimeloyl-ACP methyl ester carboxylesterase